MNWGVFLVLVGFLLPLALIVRLVLAVTAAGRPLGDAAQRLRVAVLLLLMLPITGKGSAAILAITGRPGSAGRLQIEFMATPWGWAHFAATLAAVIGCDLMLPTLVVALDAAPIAAERPAAPYVRRDLAVVAICCFLGWMAAR